MAATPTERREQLLPFFRLRSFEPRETVYAEGERGTHVAMIRGGLVKLVRFSPSGDERIVRLGMPGDTIGIELMLGGRYHHTAVALSPVELCMMPVETVEERMSHAPDFTRKLVAEWHASVDDAERFLTDLSTGNATQRVARLMLYLHDRVNGIHCPAIGREDMGALLGLTTETVSRVVAEFKREGLLRENAEGSWDCNREHLERVAEWG